MVLGGQGMAGFTQGFRQADRDRLVQERRDEQSQLNQQRMDLNQQRMEAGQLELDQAKKKLAQQKRRQDFIHQGGYDATKRVYDALSKGQQPSQKDLRTIVKAGKYDDSVKLQMESPTGQIAALSRHDSGWQWQNPKEMVDQIIRSVEDPEVAWQEMQSLIDDANTEITYYNPNTGQSRQMTKTEATTAGDDWVGLESYKNVLDMQNSMLDVQQKRQDLQPGLMVNVGDQRVSISDMPSDVQSAIYDRSLGLGLDTGGAGSGSGSGSGPGGVLEPNQVLTAIGRQIDDTRSNLKTTFGQLASTSGSDLLAGMNLDATGIESVMNNPRVIRKIEQIQSGEVDASPVEKQYANEFFELRDRLNSQMQDYNKTLNSFRGQGQQGQNQGNQIGVGGQAVLEGVQRGLQEASNNDYGTTFFPGAMGQPVSGQEKQGPGEKQYGNKWKPLDPGRNADTPKATQSGTNQGPQQQKTTQEPPPQQKTQKSQKEYQVEPSGFRKGMEKVAGDVAQETLDQATWASDTLFVNPFRQTGRWIGDKAQETVGALRDFSQDKDNWARQLGEKARDVGQEVAGQPQSQPQPQSQLQPQPQSQLQPEVKVDPEIAKRIEDSPAFKRELVRGVAEEVGAGSPEDIAFTWSELNPEQKAEMATRVVEKVVDQNATRPNAQRTGDNEKAEFVKYLINLLDSTVE